MTNITSRCRSLKRLTFFSLAVSIFASCAEFIEYPLEDTKVELLAPKDELVSSDTTIHFWWSTHEDAKFYRLQVTRPNFEQPESAILDTVVSADKLSLLFKKGKYTWRVRPENNGSHGQYVYRTFEIEPAP